MFDNTVHLAILRIEESTIERLRMLLLSPTCFSDDFYPAPRGLRRAIGRPHQSTAARFAVPHGNLSLARVARRLQGVLLTVVHHIAVRRAGIFAVSPFTCTVCGLKDRIVTRRDTAFVICMSGHRRQHVSTAASSVCAS